LGTYLAALTSRRLLAAEEVRMGASRDRRRARRASLLAGLVLGPLLGLAACGGGGGDSADRPSPGLSLDRPSATKAPDVAATPSAERSRGEIAPPTRSRGPDPTEPADNPNPPPAEPPAPNPPPQNPNPPPAEPPAPNPPAQNPNPPPAEPPPPAPTASVSAAASSAESGGMGTLLCVLLIGLVAVLIGGLIIWNSRRKSAWDAQVTALAIETRTVVATRLPPVLTAENAGQRGLSWPPLRAGLVDLAGRWGLLTERAPDDARRSRSLQVHGLLQDLVAAVDAENEALATGRDWTLLRPRVVNAERALVAALVAAVAAEQVAMPPAAGEPGPPAYGR
jgi:hypothetical protein